MTPVALFLLCIAGIFLIGTLGEMIFHRTQVPDVVWLMLTGMLLGPVLHWVTRSQLLQLAPYFSALTLVFVLFEGGSRLEIVTLYRSAARAVLLSFMTFAFSTLGIFFVCWLMVQSGWLPADWTWRQELLVGAIVGGTSPIVIMAAMLRPNIAPGVSNLLSLESALSDVLSIVAVTTLIEIFKNGTFNAGMPWLALLRSLGFGLLLGALAGAGWLLLLNWLKQNQHAYPITLSALLVLYVVIEWTGGSAALGVLAFAVVVGNASHIGVLIKLPTALELHDDVRGFHSQMVFIVKSFFFTFLGAMLGPPWGMAAGGVLLGIALLALRFPGAWLALLGAGFDRKQRRLVFLSVPRGVAAGVLATLPAYAGIPATDTIPNIVFACVFASILLFAFGFPLVTRQAVEAHNMEDGL